MYSIKISINKFKIFKNSFVPLLDKKFLTESSVILLVMILTI